MTINHVVTWLSLVIVMATGASCDRTSGLKGQTNTTLTFYGKAVDQDGKPLSGARFQFRLEAYPKDWTFNTRGRDNDVSMIDAVSDAHGRFQFVVTGCQLIRMKAECEGYHHFCDLDNESRPSNIGVSNFFYSLISWSNLCYKSDPDFPAVFVFVKDGVKEVSALPCKGGYNSANGNGTAWRLNKPGWPREPSLDDVDWKDGQPRKNIEIPLVFKVVDTEGRPRPNVAIYLEVERYRSLEEMRANHHQATVRTSKERLETKSDSNGLARVTANGFRLLEVRVPWGIRLAGETGVQEFMDSKGNVICRRDEASPIVLEIGGSAGRNAITPPATPTTDDWSMALDGRSQAKPATRPK